MIKVAALRCIGHPTSGHAAQVTPWQGTARNSGCVNWANLSSLVGKPSQELTTMPAQPRSRPVMLADASGTTLLPADTLVQRARSIVETQLPKGVLLQDVEDKIGKNGKVIDGQALGNSLLYMLFGPSVRVSSDVRATNNPLNAYQLATRLTALADEIPLVKDALLKLASPEMSGSPTKIVVRDIRKLMDGITLEQGMRLYGVNRESYLGALREHGSAVGIHFGEKFALANRPGSLTPTEDHKIYGVTLDDTIYIDPKALNSKDRSLTLKILSYHVTRKAFEEGNATMALELLNGRLSTTTVQYGIQTDEKIKSK